MYIYLSVWRSVQPPALLFLQQPGPERQWRLERDSRRCHPRRKPVLFEPPSPARPAIFLGHWTTSHNNSKIRPRNGGPEFNDMSALFHIQPTGQQGLPIASSIECAIARVCSHVTHMGGSGGDVDDAGVAAFGPPGPALCRRHPGFARSMWHVNVAIHAPGPCGAGRRVVWALAHINNSSLGNDGHGFLVSRPLARPAWRGCTFRDRHSLGAPYGTLEPI